MRSWPWWTLIALALLAIGGGFFSGQSNAHPPPTVVLHPDSASLVHAASAIEAADQFSDDDVVVERRLPVAHDWMREDLAFVIGLAGNSAAIESNFLRLGFPVTFDVDPRAPEAPTIARVARETGDPVYVHVDAAPAPATLAGWRGRLGAFDGVASRASAGMAEALRGTGLRFFDERGVADPRPFLRVGVRFAQRDITADDRGQESYVRFMLERAAIRSRHDGRTVVLLRPQPDSLRALQSFEAGRTNAISSLP